MSVFEHPAVKAAGLKLQPAVGSHMVLLKKIDSPLAIGIDQAARGVPAEERTKMTFSDEETLELIFTFCKPPPELRAILRKGRDAYREAALAALSDNLPIGLIQRMEAEVMAGFSGMFIPAGEDASAYGVEAPEVAHDKQP